MRLPNTGPIQGPMITVAAKKDIDVALSSGINKSDKDPPTMVKTPAPANAEITRKEMNTAGF
jgi:hypothetical protein